MKASPSQNLLAWTCDTFGGETYDLILSDLGRSECGGVPKEVDRIKDVDSGVVWGKDDQTVYYLKMDAEHRPFQVWRHKVGGLQANDELVYDEPNKLFWVSVSKTLDGEFVLVSTDSSETSEVHSVDLSVEGAQVKVVAPRQQGVLYSVDHRNGYFFIATNQGAHTNFKLAVAPVSNPGLWASLNDGVFADGRDTSPGAVMVDGVTCFKDFVCVEGRANGFSKVWVMEMGEGAQVKSHHQVDFFGNEACSCGLSSNAEFETPSLRLGYSSLVDPPSTLEYAVEDRSLSLVKRKEVPHYDPDSYATARVLVKGHDGAEVPVSLVFHKDLVDPSTGLPKAPAPLHLYGYGSYGICIDPGFSAKRLPLLNRGMVYAIAHIRGGAEMGRAWYEEQGKYLNKRNTFMDFISCAEHLHSAGWSTPEMTSTEGRSAGGLLMGTCLNMRPDLFKVAVAGVPFVDIMTTMCDASIPLTVGEWEEWGNPNEAKFFSYMLSYSPMNNILAQDYPSILVTAGLHDPRVAYWEPMKWVAKLREHKTDANPLLLKVDLEAGHFSASDRYKYLKELSFDYAFLLDQLGLKEAPVKK